MSLHINRFIDRVRSFESRGQKDFNMPLQDAKDLHADITRLLLVLHAMHEQSDIKTKDEIVTVELTGGHF